MGTHADWVPPERFDEYRLIRPLGRGSMGQVWLAHDTVLDRLVAVKLIAELPARDAVRQRFLTEARAAARVQHPNIISVYRIGEIGPRPYLISEYVRGDSLDHIARPVPSPRLLAIAIGLARGLAAAHRRGVLHRDLKPANAILSDTGDVKLLDFGLAKLLHDVAPPPAPRSPAAAPDLPGEPTLPPPAARPAPDARDAQPGEPGELAEPAELAERAGRDAHATATPTSAAIALPDVTIAGAAIGTPSYMPPEAWRGEPATPRSDVYSLGALLYELASGAPPHRGDSPDAIRGSALGADLPPLATAAPGIDPRLAAIVERCLRRDPAARFASGDAVRDALEALDGNDDAVPPAHDRPPQRRWPVIATAALGLALAALVSTALRHSTPRRAGAAAAPCPDGMVAIPPGTFAMGSPDGTGDTDEHPQHAVTLSAYCIDRTEVTVAAYAACVRAGSCSASPATVHWTAYSTADARRYSQWCNGSDRPDHPINCIDHDQAAAYCAWKHERLPTEAEWEYAARGGDARSYPWGEAAPSAARLNLCGAECAAMATRELGEDWKAKYDGDDGWPATAPVGSYPAGASPFGVLDMAGNVWEWTDDWYGPYTAAAASDPHGATTGTSRVSRGGGWASRGAHSARAADRNWLDPTARDCDLGFRCARRD